MKLWPNSKEEADPEETPLLTSEMTWPFNTDSDVMRDLEDLDKPVSVMLVDMTGLEWNEIEPLLPVAKTAAQEREMIPVLVVDLTDFVKLREVGMAYDVLPNAAANEPLQQGLDWPAYLARRRTLLMEKWRPGAIVHLSDNAEAWE